MQQPVVDVVKVLQSKINVKHAESFIDTRKSRQYPVYYTVGDRVHYSDVKAYQDFSKNLNDEILFHFDSPMFRDCLLYTSPSPRDGLLSRMPSSA